MRIVLGLVALSVVGCASDGEIEDGEDDAFLGDGKSDAFGVEDWSPDGAAVLKLVSTASATKLDEDIGLSTRVANAIVAQRTAIGGTYTDLAELDAAKWVGKAVFQRLLRYAAEHKLFKTSLRVPLLTNDDGNDIRSITDHNPLAKAFGVTGFARYTFVDETTPFGAKMASYNTRLQDLAARANVTIDDEMLMYQDSLSDYALWSDHVCFIGDAKEVADVSAEHYDGMLGDMYSVWGWRVGSNVYINDGVADYADELFGSEWSTWSSETDVLIMSTNNDDGDNPTATVVPPCR